MATTTVTTFLSSSACGEEFVSARFARPEGFAFLAGQYVQIGLETSVGEQRKPFSISSAPQDDFLEISTRPSASEFKRALLALRPGDAVSLGAPAGRLVLDNEIKRVAFLVGGTGIAPVRSIVKDAVARATVFDDACVFYGVKTAHCALFAEELAGLTAHGVRVVLVVENPEGSEGRERGLITASTVRRHVSVVDDRPFFVAGPPGMVVAMEQVLDELGIDPQRRHVERFGAVASEDSQSFGKIVGG